MDARATPAVGTEETGARLVSNAPCMDYGAAVPIKKRRYPFIQPPSLLLMPEEAVDAKQTEVFYPSNACAISNPSIASEHSPSSLEKESSFGLNLPENLDLNKVDKVQLDNHDSSVALADCKNAKEKPCSPIEKCAKLFEGRRPSVPSDAMYVDQKVKTGETKNVAFADKTQGKTDFRFAATGPHNPEAVQGSSGHQTLRCGISTDLTLSLGRKIVPTCWYQGNLKELSLSLSLSGQESNHHLADEVPEGDSSASRRHVNRSIMDLNVMADATGDSAHVFSSGSVPLGDLTFAFREHDKKDAGKDLHAVDQSAVAGRTSSPFDYKEGHIGRYPYLGPRRLNPYSIPNCESPSVSTIPNSDGNPGTTVKFTNKKENRVKKEPSDEPVDFCSTKPEKRTERCGTIGNFLFGTHHGKSTSIKVEPDCMNQQINPVINGPIKAEEVQDFSESPPNEAETMKANGPSGVESCQPMLASTGGHSDQHPIENDHSLGASFHHQECDAANMSSDSTVTNVAASVNNDMVDSLFTKNLPPGAQDTMMQNVEDSACDGGKIEISGCEDAYSYDSKYESDEAPSASADHAKNSYLEDDDYEDGEVREQLVLGVSPLCTGADQVENASSAIQVTDCNAQLASKQDVRSQPTGIEIENHVNGSIDATPADTCNIGIGQSRGLFCERVSSNSYWPSCLGELVDGDFTKHVREEMICQPGSGQSNAENTAARTLSASKERVHIDNVLRIKEKGHLSKAGAPVNSEVSSGEGNKRQIINLSSLSSLSLPDKARFISDQPFPLRTLRKRLPDSALEVDKSHLRGRNRGGDGSDEIPRGRNEYSLSRNSRSNFSRDSDIVSNRIICNWDDKREFSPELYKYTGERHTTRRKYASDYQNNDVAAGDGLRVGKCWSSRRLNNDELNLCRQSSIRSSPCCGGVVHVPRNVSSTRCKGRDEADVISLWNSHKFRRDFGSDEMGSVFIKCSRTSYEDNPDGLARRDRKFLSFKNDRVLSQIRSNSPVRRNRSPNHGSSRRRSPEGFEGHLEQSQRRYLAMYRKDRIRSPDRSCIHHKITRRQHPHFSQKAEDTRQIHLERDTGLRSRFTNRSSPCRGTFKIRGHGVNTRDRPGNEYSKAHMRTGWSRDISRDGESVEKGLREDRGPRHFQSTHS